MSLNQCLQSPAKQEVRQELAHWFRKERRGGEIRLLSLPGTSWTFERLLRPESCIGLEKDPARAAWCSRNKPRNRSYSLFCRDATDYLADYALSPDPGLDDWNCVWLDLCGQLSRNSIKVIRALSLAASRRENRHTYAAITVLATRENGNIGDLIRDLKTDLGPIPARAAIVSHMLEAYCQFELGWWSSYKSSTEKSVGSSMLLVAGKLTPTST
jgi:hypothetical protein